MTSIGIDHHRSHNQAWRASTTRMTRAAISKSALRNAMYSGTTAIPSGSALFAIHNATEAPRAISSSLLTRALTAQSSSYNVPLTRSRVFAAIGLNGLLGDSCSGHAHKT